MGNYFEMTRSLAADHKRRLPCLALVAGREALIRDAQETVIANERDPDAQRWMWPGPGDLEPAKIGGRRESQTVYDLKLKMAPLDNVWERSLREVAAEPFTHEPTFEGWPAPLVEEIPGKEGKPPKLGGWIVSLGDSGQTLLDIWRESFFQKIALGITYQLIDLPIEAGGAPYWVPINPAQITRIVPPLPGGKLREVAIKIPAGGQTNMEPVADPSKVPDEPDGSKPESWWVRVYRTSEYIGGAEDGPVLFRHAAQKEGAKGKQVVWIDDWQPLEGRSADFVEIPLLPFYGKRVSAYRGHPEFADATSLQMDLWRSMTDYAMRKKNDYINLLILSGAKLSDIEQSARVVALRDPQARGTPVETTGEAQKAAREDHEVLRHRIRWACMRKIQQSKPQPQQTATEIKADVKGAGSWLEAQVLMDIFTIEQGLRWTAELGGLDGSSGSVDLFHDFTDLPGSWESLEQTYRESDGRLVPPSLYWRERHRRGGIAADEKPDEIAADVDARLREDLV